MRLKNNIKKRIASLFFPSFSLPVTEQRARSEKMARFFRLPKGVQAEPIDANGVPARWVFPEGAAGGVILYFHGGAYCLGSVTAHMDLLSRLALAAGRQVLAVDYRLAPEHPHPAAVEDAVTAYGWLLAQGYSAEQVIIAGDSAGGGLALAALLALRDAGQPLPAGAVCISPWTDLALSGASIHGKQDVEVMLDAASLAQFAGWYANGHSLTAPLLSPLYGDLSGLPPMLIHAGTEEILLDDALRLAQKARAAGVEVDLHVWQGMVHVFPIFPFFPETKQALQEIGTFVQKRLV